MLNSARSESRLVTGLQSNLMDFSKSSTFDDFEQFRGSQPTFATVASHIESGHQVVGQESARK